MFTQEQGTNVLYCNGCTHHCKYGACASRTGPGYTLRYVPTLNGKKILTYTMQGGHTTDMTLCQSAPDALQLAAKISKLCDNYKTR